MKENVSKKKTGKVIAIIIFIILLAILGYLIYETQFNKNTRNKSSDYEEYDPNYEFEKQSSNSINNSQQSNLIESNSSSNISNKTSNSNSNTSNLTSSINSNVSNVTSTANSNKNISVNSISLSSSSISLVVGDTTTLKATISPSNATNKNITWKSSNNSVATVVNGKVSAIKEGKATISATTKDGNKVANCTVTVNKKYISVTGGYWSHQSYTVYIGETKSMKNEYVISPSNATDKTIKWSVADKSIATVDSNGVVKGLKYGNTKLNVTLSNNKTYSVSLYIRNNPANYTIKITRTSYGHGGGNAYMYYMQVLKNGSQTKNYRSVTYNGVSFTSNDLNSVITNKVKVDESIKYGYITDENGATVTPVKVNYDY